ncbi:hypothetical protein [Methylobacterium sp. NEAU K]|uniref:hypothetical protein n=1 Tax=Methylobacterium sp. NEAU K TaxID=3064946 RepID=UPI002736E0AA|nr:hypothetical protein [Methylobacterium sp. NEAU K]MDP4005050.1 hypothetical protein [Methylobacterium sp. NEAU K]
MNRFLLAALAALIATPALAADGSFSIPYGDLVIQCVGVALNIVEAIAVVAIPLYVKKRWGDLAGLVVTNSLVKGELDEARNAGMNAVAGAMKGKVVHVDGVPQVVAAGVDHLMRKADVNALAAYALKAAGGPEGVARWIWAELHLPEDATRENSLVPALEKVANAAAAPKKAPAPEKLAA